MAKPPEKREDPSTSNRLDRTDPSKEYFRTSIFPFCKAKIAMISSVTFPHVAFNSPPTVASRTETAQKQFKNKIHKYTFVNQGKLFTALPVGPV